MAWIETHQSLLTHKKTLRLARLLGLNKFDTVGRLVALWCWALDNAPEGMLGAADDFCEVIAEVMGWQGDPMQLVESLAAVGFIDQEDTQPYLLHDWEEYAGKLIDRRKANAAKQKAWRDRHKTEHVDKSNRHSNHGVTVTEPTRNGATVPYRTVPYQDGYSEGESKILPFAAAAADADGAAGAARVSDVLELPVLATAAVAGSTNGSGHSANGRTPTPRPQSNGRAKTEASVVQTAPPPSAAPPPAPSRASAANSPRKPARPVNEIWDAMVDVFGYEPESRQERSNWGKIVKGLKEAGATGAEVRRRAANHAASGYAWDLTPNALVTHWGELKDVRVQGANARAKPAAAARASPAPPERFSITSSPPFVITEPH